MDVEKSIRMASDTGKVKLGVQSAKKIALNGSARLVIIAENCPVESKQDLEKYCGIAKIPVMHFAGTSIELGTICGKPFPVSVMSVLDVGNSDILESFAKG